MEAALILVRLGQYLGVAGLYGGAFFLARQAPEPANRSEWGLLFGSALVLTGATLAALVIQAAMMAGLSTPWSDPSMIGMVLTQTAFGYAVAARLLASVGAIVALSLSPRRPKLWLLAALGAVATATLAWGGHGAADEGVAGAVHLTTDIVHLLAAALWIGALGALVVMAADRRGASGPIEARRLHVALEGFSGLGSVAVALLIFTGLVNGWFLIGPTHLQDLFTTVYGRLLLAKLLLFAGMLRLAAANRWRHTPRLRGALDRQDLATALPGLRRSLALETAAALGVLALVAWLGTLAPPMSS